MRPEATTMRILFFLLLAGVVLLSSCGINSVPPEAISRSSITLPQGKSIGLQKAEGKPLFNLEQVGDVIAPLEKSSVSVRLGMPVTILGWAVDESGKTTASGVDVVIDGKAYASEYGAEREDVGAYYKVPAYKNSGYTLTFPAGSFGKGRHQVCVRVLAQDGKKYWESSPLTFNVQ